MQMHLKLVNTFRNWLIVGAYICSFPCKSYTTQTLNRTLILTRDVPNIRFVLGQIVSSERIQIVSLYMYSAASDVYGRLHSVIASCSISHRVADDFHPLLVVAQTA